MQSHKLEGQTFGRLTVLSREGSNKKGSALWRCRCVCGKEKVVIGWAMIAGNVHSCGCLQKESANRAGRTHGMSQQPEYRIYRSILARCYQPSDTNYPKYGAKGVTVCDRWNPAEGGSFENFYSDMGPRPTPSHNIDKEAVDLGNKVYGPEGCRWVLAKVNQRNRANVMRIEYQGEEILAIDLAARLGISNATLQNRIKRGWPQSRWAEPVQRRNPRSGRSGQD